MTKRPINAPGALGVAAGAQQGPNAAQRFAQAEALASAGRPAEAAAIYRELLKGHPSQPLLMNNLALALRSLGELDEAEGLLRRAVEIAPREPGLRNNLGNLLRRKEAYNEAEVEYRAALALKPDDADTHFNLGLTLESLERLEEAGKALQEAIRLRPGYYQAITRLGVIRRQLGSAEDALPFFDQALSIEPNFFDAHYYRGDALFALNRFADAVAAQRRALELRPNSFEASFALGNALTSDGVVDEGALVAYWRATELKPDHPQSHYGFSQLAWQTGRQDIYRRSYAHARDTIGANPDLLLQEARMIVAHGQGAEAEQLLRFANTVAPERADIAAFLGHTLIGQGKWNESASLFQQAIAIEPNSAFHRRGYALLMMRTGEARRAVEILEEARGLDQLDQLTLATLGLAYREAEDATAYVRLMDFGRYVRSYDISLPSGFSDALAFNTALAEELQRMHTSKVEPFDQTLRGGTQTPGNLFAEPSRAVGLVRDSISEAVASYIRDLPDDPEHPMSMRKQGDFSFSGAWSCRLRSSGFHTNHVHPMGWISSAYYVHLPEAVDDENARQGWLKFGESNVGLGGRDTPAWHVRPAVGRLVLFPSYFWHGTVPFMSSDNRLTIAFDVVPGKVAPSATMNPY